MSPPLANAILCLATGLGLIVVALIIRHFRRQDEKDDARRAQLLADLDAELRRPR